MAAALLGTIAGAFACIGAAALLGWVLDRRRRRQWERAAAPRLRVMDGGNRHDWRELARRAPTQRVRAIGARRT